MPIERKDRSFDLIFDQVTMDEIPADYIIEINISLLDGTNFTLTNQDLRNIEENGQSPMSAIAREDISDIAVKIDYEAIKRDVQNGVNGYLGKFFDK
jgi:hypothetical protein